MNLSRRTVAAVCAAFTVGALFIVSAPAWGNPGSADHTRNAAVALAEPHPEFAGQRRQPPAGGIYLIDPEGYRRGVPGTVYWDFFRHPGDVIPDPHIYLIAERPALSIDAFFARLEGDGVYLVSNGEKRGIAGPSVDKYDFNLDKARSTPKWVLDLIPEGPTWW